MSSMKELSEKVGNLTKANQALLDKAEREQGGQLTAEQEQEWDARDKDIDATLASIESIKKQNLRVDKMKSLLELADKPIGRQSTPSAPAPLGQSKTSEAVKLSISGQELHFQPGTPDFARAQPDYQLSFSRYLQTGNPEGLSSAEALGMKAGDNARGGYLAPMTFVAQLIKFLDDNVFMRQLATVFPNVSPTGMGAPSWDADPGDADWTAEVLSTDISEDDTARTGRRELIPNDLSKLVLASRKLINGSTSMSAEQLIIQRLGYKFALTEEKAFLTGTGVGKPLGVFTASDLGIPTSRDVATGSTTGFDADDVIGCFFGLKEAYQRRATWLVSREWVKRARKLKTSGSGEYLWAPATSDTPGTIMGRPYMMSENVPTTYTTGQYIAVVGDFSFYWIADCYDLTVDRLDELFRLKKQIGFIGEKSTDGAPVLAEAFSRMKTA